MIIPERCDNDIIREQQIAKFIKRDIKNFLNKVINNHIESKLLKEQKKAEKLIDSLSNKINNIQQKNNKYLDLPVDKVISKSEYRSYVELNTIEIEKITQKVNAYSSE